MKNQWKIIMKKIKNTKIRNSTNIAAKNKFNFQYHLFWGDWHPEESCGHARSLNPERVQVRACCNGRKNGQAFALYNVNRQECCLNGEIANVGECWKKNIFSVNQNKFLFTVPILDNNAASVTEKNCTYFTFILLVNKFV